MTPPVTDSNTTALPDSSIPAPGAPPASKLTLPASHLTSTASVPVSTRPKPRKKVKAAVEDAAASTALPEPIGTTLLPVDSTPPRETVVQNATVSSVDPEAGKFSKPVKTYGSKDKSVGLSNRPLSEPTKIGDLTSTRAPTSRVEPSKRKVVQSKSRAIIDSESELSDSPVTSTIKQNDQPDAVRQVDDPKDESAKRPLQEPKRNGKRRAIITSDDEDDFLQDKTPDSKRRKPEADKSGSKRSSPKKKVETVRGSSIDPLDMNADAGLSGKAGQMEVSVELSPSNFAEFGLANDKDANDNHKSVAATTKSPNKVHFVEPAPGNEEEVIEAQPKSKQPKSKLSRQDDAYGDEPESFAAPADDEDDEDDFVPSGSKKSKAKAKAAKAKKTAPPKAKAAKGKKVSQAKGKNVKSVDVIDESVAVPEAAVVDSVPEVSEPSVVSSTTLGSSTEEAAEPVGAIAEVTSTKLSTAKKSKAKKPAASSKNKSKSLKAISDDEDLHSDAQADRNNDDSTGVGVSSNPEAAGVVVNKSEKQPITGTEVESINLKTDTITLPMDKVENDRQEKAVQVAENNPVSVATLFRSSISERNYFYFRLRRRFCNQRRR